jgi:hypothetical protein
MGKFLEFLSIILMLGVFVALLYVLWTLYPKDAISLGDYSLNGSFDFGNGEYQFYPNMRYRDNVISYYIDSGCDKGKTENMKRAMQILEDKTSLEFVEGTQSAEIQILCSNIAPEPEEKGHFIAGEGGPSEIVNATSYSVIFKGKIALYREEKCDQPLIALHELIHALGFNHNNDKKSIMYPLSQCNQILDDYIVNEINRLYSADTLPDLAIEQVNANRSGIYLNFKITVANYGLADAENPVLIIESDKGEIKRYDLNKIKIGTKKYLSVENLRIFGDVNRMIFSVETGKDELNLDNNVAILNVE